MLEDLPVPTAPILFGKYYVVDFAKQHRTAQVLQVLQELREHLLGTSGTSGTSGT